MGEMRLMVKRGEKIKCTLALGPKRSLSLLSLLLSLL